MKRREFITLLNAAAVAVVTMPRVVAGQDYPSRSITLIVNFPPGGSTDAMARIIREPLSQALGQSIIIDNRGGAGGTAGAAAVANARPDGYTLLLSVSSALTTNRYLQRNFAISSTKASAPTQTLRLWLAYINRDNSISRRRMTKREPSTGPTSRSAAT